MPPDPRELAAVFIGGALGAAGRAALADGPGAGARRPEARRDVTLRPVFHVELRQFPHSARAFNLSLEELRTGFLSPWVAGRTLEWGQRHWAPDRAKLTIYEGPELRPDELGMGRGWANAARGGDEVTERVLADERQAARGGEPLQALKVELQALCAQAPQSLPAVAALAGQRWSQMRASERLSLAEQAIWELLHERRVTLVRETAAGPEPVGEADWQPVLLAWGSWTGTDAGGETFAISSVTTER